MAHYPNVQYLTGAWQAPQFPPDSGVEVAFAGRSNSGKSSAINAITGRTAIARVSKTPGRTQLINFFTLGDQQRLVDLPGYGFAKVPPEMKRHWYELMAGYFAERKSLRCLMVLMDSRRPLKDTDWDMLHWGQEHGVHCHVLLSKCDKLSQSESIKVLREVTTELKERGATAQLFSATSHRGVDDARRVLDEMLKQKNAPVA